jgi:hypothetical protein
MEEDRSLPEAGEGEVKTRQKANEGQHKHGVEENDG